MPQFTLRKYPCGTVIESAASLREVWLATLNHFEPFCLVSCHLDELAENGSFHCQLDDGTIEVYEIKRETQ